MNKNHKVSRVKIYPVLNAHQELVLKSGGTLVWLAEDENYRSLFESNDLKKVIEYANYNLKVSHISKYTQE